MTTDGPRLLAAVVGNTNPKLVAETGRTRTMTEEITFETKADAVADIRTMRGRSIVTVEYAYGVADAFGVSHDALSTRPAGEMAAITSGDPDEHAIGVGRLVCDIVAALGGDASTSSPYMGRGTHHDHLLDANIETLEGFVDDEPEAEA